jgi:hypothetical protein
MTEEDVLDLGLASKNLENLSRLSVSADTSSRASLSAFPTGGTAGEKR